VHINWFSFVEVFLVSFAAAVGVITLFAVGVAVLPSPGASTVSTEGSSGQVGSRIPISAGRIVSGLCFLACALVVGYGIYVVITG
jgi:hypothetical protein